MNSKDKELFAEIMSKLEDNDSQVLTLGNCLFAVSKSKLLSQAINENDYEIAMMSERNTIYDIYKQWDLSKDSLVAQSKKVKDLLYKILVKNK